MSYQRTSDREIVEALRRKAAELREQIWYLELTANIVEALVVPTFTPPPPKRHAS